MHVTARFHKGVAGLLTCLRGPRKKVPLISFESEWASKSEGFPAREWGCSVGVGRGDGCMHLSLGNRKKRKKGAVYKCSLMVNLNNWCLAGWQQIISHSLIKPEK